MTVSVNWAPAQLIRRQACSLNRTQLALLLFHNFRLQSCVMKQTTV